MNFLTSIACTVGLSVCPVPKQLSELAHPNPNGTTIQVINSQRQPIAHFPNKTFINGKCYFMTKTKAKGEKLNVEQSFNNGCAGG
jgi:hypothetical protein